MSSSLDLTKRLRDIDDTHLSAVLRESISHPAGLKDYFDVADALLSESSLILALQQFTGSELLQLSQLDTASEEVRQRVTWHLLASDTTGELYPEVTAVLSSFDITESSSTPVEPVTGAHNQAALENALIAIGALDDLGRLLSHTPAKTLATGGLSSPEHARLKSLVPEDVNIESLLELGESAGIFAHNGRWWVATADFFHWQKSTSQDRWLWCARAWKSALSPALTHVFLQSPVLPSEKQWLSDRFPCGFAWIEKPLQRAVAQAQLLGLASKKLGQTGYFVLVGNWEAVTAEVDKAVPATVSQVFIQHDFTVVAPGPLAPHLDTFIRNLCVVETRGVASTFRITGEGVDLLLSEGMSANEIIETLRQASSTDLPQAIEYFVRDRAERFGSITVKSSQHRSMITCKDELLASMLLSDRNLNALGLKHHAETVLVCVHPPQVVIRALNEAKYSALAIDELGEIVTAPPLLLGDSSQPAEDSFDDLVTRLRSQKSEELSDDATWISRQLELAVREKALVTVTVNMPDGARDFFVEARSFANGRLRCLDRTTEVERTLPASHITHVSKAS